MTDAELLTKVKSALGITGTYQDDTLMVYIEEVKAYMTAAGVKREVLNMDLCTGAICRGVADLWSYGAGEANFSQYFRERVIQLSYETGGGE